MKSRWAPVSSLTHSARTVGFTTQSTTMLAVPLLSAQPRGGPMLTGTLTPSTSLPSLSRRFVGLGAPTAAAEHTLTKYFCGAPAPASRMPPPSGAFCVPVVLSTKPGVGTMRMPSSVAGRVAPRRRARARRAARARRRRAPRDTRSARRRARAPCPAWPFPRARRPCRRRPRRERRLHELGEGPGRAPAVPTAPRWPRWLPAGPCPAGGPRWPTGGEASPRPRAAARAATPPPRRRHR